MSLNHFSVTGNLTKDSELKATASGKPLLLFGIAVNTRVRDSQNGGWKNTPNFFNCVVWGQRAEGLSRILKKGTKVALEGHLHQNSWEHNGRRRSSVELVVTDVDVLSSRDNKSKQYVEQQIERDLDEPEYTYEVNTAAYDEPYHDYSLEDQLS